MVLIGVKGEVDIFKEIWGEFEEKYYYCVYCFYEWFEYKCCIVFLYCLLSGCNKKWFVLVMVVVKVIRVDSNRGIVYDVVNGGVLKMIE